MAIIYCKFSLREEFKACQFIKNLFIEKANSKFHLSYPYMGFIMDLVKIRFKFVQVKPKCEFNNIKKG